MNNVIPYNPLPTPLDRFLAGLATLLSLLCLLTTTTHGQQRVVQLTNTSVHPTSVTANYPEEVCAVIASPYTLNTSGNTLNFSAGSASPFQLIRQANTEDCSIAADFPMNTKVLAVNTIHFGFRLPLTITFSTPVTEMGFQAQIFAFGTERFTFEVFNGEESLGIFTVEDQMDFTQSGLKGYVGARALGNDRITKVKVWAEFPDDPKHNEAVANKFAISSVSFRLDRDE